MISSIRGGSARNAIPREAFCELALPQSKAFMFMTYVNFYNHVMKSEYLEAEPDLSVSFEPSTGETPRFMSPQFQRGLIRALCKCPNGVIKMSGGAPDAVETSSNLAIVRTTDAAVEVQFLVRSAVDAERDALAEKVKSSFYQNGTKVRVGGEYPGWKPDPNSRLLQAMKKAYSETFGEDPAVKVVHAGLECGIIAAKYPEMEFVSVGPTIKHPHSPDERLHIPSVEKFWKYLTAVLKREI
jgi:dipeptidase D